MTLARPRYLGDGDSGVGDPAGNGIDWGAMDLTIPTFELPPGALSAPFDLSTAANDVVKGAQTWFGAETAVNNANYASQLAKARAQAAVAQAKAGGANAAMAAKAGLPSPTLLLAAGVALGAVLLLRR